MASRILIVDDDQEICSLVKTYLERSEFEVDVAYDGRMARQRAEAAGGFDLVLLDVMLPGQSGLELCREFRAAGDVPVIMLSAMGQLADKVAGLEIGADDYIVKPFEPRELLARTRAAIRRRAGAARSGAGEGGAENFALNGLSVDVAARSARGRDGSEIPLTFAEFELLALLLSHPNETLPRSAILQAVFSRTTGIYDRSADVLLSRLRKKVLAAGVTLNIESVRGIGYMLVAQVTRW